MTKIEDFDAQTPLPLDLSGVSTEQLSARRDYVEVALGKIRTQVDDARRSSRTTGLYADSGWFTRAQHALRRMGAEHQRLLREIGARKKAEAAEQHRQRREDIVRNREDRDVQGLSIAKTFVEIARQRLDPGLFEAWLEEAKDTVALRLRRDAP